MKYGETMWEYKYIAIDFSSKNIAIVFTSISDKIEFTCTYFVTKEKNFADRFIYLMEKFEEFLVDKYIYVAYIEEPAIAMRHKSVKMVNQVSGMILALLAEHKISFKEIHNKTWKKVVVGNGNAKKKDIMNYVVDKYKIKVKISQDVADAACIYEYGNKMGWETE